MCIYTRALIIRTHTLHAPPPQVGPELPEPGVVSWDPTLRYLALAYLRQVQMLRAQPTLEVLGCLPIVGTTSAVWGIRQLYVATPTSILLAFVAAEEPPAGEGLGGGGLGEGGEGRRGRGGGAPYMHSGSSRASCM